MADFYKSRKTTFISCSHLRFRLCAVLAFLMTMSKTACQNSIWIKFGDCSKNAILGLKYAPLAKCLIVIPMLSRGCHFPLRKKYKIEKNI